MHLIPLSIPDLSNKEEDAVASCIRSGWVSSAGPDIPDFEEDIAKLATRKYGIATASGTAALQLLLSSFDIGYGDKVIMPTYCFAATANAIIHSGAEPIFVDITRTDWTIEPELVEQALQNHNDVKAIIAIDVLNNIPDFKELKKLTVQYNCHLIEDAAGALATETAYGKGGSFGDASIFSFNGNKILTTGGGGMIVTDNEALAKKAHHLCAQARSSANYTHDAIGHNYRMPNLNAALGRAQVSRLQDMLQKRQYIFSAYQNLASDLKHLQMQPLSYGTVSNGWLSSFFFDTKIHADDFVKFMAEEKIMTRQFWLPLDSQTPYAKYPAYLDGVSDDIAPRVVSLPCSSNLTNQELERVLHSIKEWQKTQN